MFLFVCECISLFNKYSLPDASVRISLSTKKLVMDNPRSIIDLPVEVLDLIFKHLIYMNYKVELAKVHEKLTKAFVYHSKNEFRRLKVTPWLSNESFLVVIQECGHTTEELVFDRSCDFWNDILIEAVTKYCTNLKSFTAVLYRSDSDQICSFLRKINKLLLSLSLEQRSRFPFEILKVVGEMTQLKELSVKGYIDENGKVLIAQYNSF